MVEPLQRATQNKKTFKFRIMMWSIFIITMILLIIIIFMAYGTKQKDARYCEDNEESCLCLSYQEIAKEDIHNYYKYYIKNGKPMICKHWCRSCS